jgi:hypothetical protein
MAAPAFGNLSVGQLSVTTLQLAGDLSVNRHIVTSGGNPTEQPEQPLAAAVRFLSAAATPPVQSPSAPVTARRQACLSPLILTSGSAARRMSLSRPLVLPPAVSHITSTRDTNAVFQLAAPHRRRPAPPLPSITSSSIEVILRLFFCIISICQRKNQRKNYPQKKYFIVSVKTLSA